MNVKGFILEDGRGREFVMVCNRLGPQSGRTFALRGWQRRRLVPLQYTERELRKIVGGVLITLNDLFKSLPRFHDDVDDTSSDTASHGTQSLKLRKDALLRKLSSEGGDIEKNRWP